MHGAYKVLHIMISVSGQSCHDKGPMNNSLAALCCQQMESELPPGDHNITREMLENMVEILKDNNLKKVWLLPTERKGINWAWINNGNQSLLITHHNTL